MKEISGTEIQLVDDMAYSIVIFGQRLVVEFRNTEVYKKFANGLDDQKCFNLLKRVVYAANKFNTMISKTYSKKNEEFLFFNPSKATSDKKDLYGFDIDKLIIEFRDTI